MISMPLFLFLLCCISSLDKREYTAILYNTSSPRLPRWTLRLGVPLPPWNSKDKKHCLYETPYVAAPLRVLGDVIAKITTYTRIPSDAPTRTRKFSWFISDMFLRRPLSSYWDSYVHSLQGGLRAKVVLERTTYCAWGVPRQVPSSVSSRILCSDVASWARHSRTLMIKMVMSKGSWAISPDSRTSPPLCL